MPISSDYRLVPEAHGGYRFRTPSELLVLSMTAVAVTDIVNVTEAGKMLGFYANVQTGLDGTPEVDLEITVDGGTKESIVFWNASDLWAANTWLRTLGFDITNNANQPGAVGDIIRVMMDAPYLTSLKVSINVRVAATSVGALNVGVFRATEQ